MAHGKGKSSSRPERDLEGLTREGSEIEWNYLQKHHFQYIAVAASPTSSDAKPSKSFPLIYPVPAESAPTHGLPAPWRARCQIEHPPPSLRFWLWAIPMLERMSFRFVVFLLFSDCLYTCNTQSLLQVRHSVPVHPLCRAPELNSLFWCWNLIIHARRKLEMEIDQKQQRFILKVSSEFLFPLGQDSVTNNIYK